MVEQGGDRGQAWKAAAGMLAPQIETDPEDPVLELGLAGRELYASLAPALLERTGIDIGLWREGIAWVAADETEAGDLRARVAWQRQQSHLSDWLDADEVSARWPWLGRTSGALWAPHEGAVEPQSLVRALLADAERAGARSWRTPRSGSISEVIVPSASLARMDDTARAMSSSRPELGLASPGSSPSSRRCSGARPDGRAPLARRCSPRDRVRPRLLYAGAGQRSDRWIDDGVRRLPFRSELRWTRQNLRECRGALSGSRSRQSAPNLGRAPTHDTRWATDHRAEPRLDGLWYATGHGRNGILLAGITGVIMRQLLSGESPGQDIEACSPTRFWRW